MARLLLKILAVMCVLLVVAVPNAQAITFASFSQIFLDDPAFVYSTVPTNVPPTAFLVSSASLPMPSVSIPITLTFNPAIFPTLPLFAGLPIIAATLTLSATSTAPVMTFGPTLIQEFPGPAAVLSTLEIRLVTPVGGQDLFLSALFTGRLSGTDGGFIASLIGTETEGVGGGTVIFSSAFFDFSGTISRGLSLSFAGITSIIEGEEVEGLFIDPKTGLFFPFVTTGTGIFTFEFGPIPEPTSYIQAGIGLSCLMALGLVQWRRRVRRLAAA